MTDPDPDGRRPGGAGGPSGAAEPGDPLASRRRRLALDHLLSADGRLTTTGLARRVTATEYDLDAGSIPVSLVQEAYLELVREHVPALERLDLLAYDPDSGHVELTTDATSVRQRLRETRDTLQAPEV